MWPLSKRMPSVSSSSRPKVLLSSTVMTPSLPTLSIASAMISPTVGSPAEMEAVEAICSLVSTSLASLASSSATAATAASMPRLSAIGFAPAATLRSPSRTSAWARTVAVVVPSPATSSVFFATSLTNSAPSRSYGSSSSISLAMLTPSLVIVGTPQWVPRTTLRPFGPSVTFTVSASTFMPRSRPRRASSPKTINLAMWLILKCRRAHVQHCSGRPAMTAATVHLRGAIPFGWHSHRERANTSASPASPYRKRSGSTDGFAVPSAALEPTLHRPPDVVGPAHLLQQPDQPCGRVELTAEHTVPGTGRVGVVGVVPAFSERDHRQWPEVRGAVGAAGGERAFPVHVADRIDRPRGVVQQGDADQARPEERRQRTLPRPRQ